MAVLQAMVDQGGRILDTPAFFRPDVPIIGELLGEMGLRDELFLIGKITVSGKEAGREHLERTVANLNKRSMDLLLIHNMRELGTVRAEIYPREYILAAPAVRVS